MTAALFFVPDGALAGVAAGSSVPLDGPEGHHAVVVRRLRVGEAVSLADGSGLVARCTVAEVGAGELTALVESVREAAPPAPRLVLAQALAKQGRDEAAVEAATELGVDEVIAWQAGRSIVQWRGERGAKALRKWVSLTEAAAKQSRRPTVPVVTGPVDTAGLGARVEQASAARGTTYVLHEEATTALARCPLGDADEILLVVGPEGGIAPEEVEVFTAAGATPVRLGETVLRSSSAGPAALAVVLAATRWRG